MNFNSTGSPQWMGAATVPTTPVSPSDPGKHGVDVDANKAWAVIDHFTDLVIGEGINGQGDTTTIADWSMY